MRDPRLIKIFEAWTEENLTEIVAADGAQKWSAADVFDDLPQEMKWGVLQKFYAVHKIYISIKTPHIALVNHTSAGANVLMDPDTENAREYARGLPWEGIENLGELWSWALIKAEDLFTEHRSNVDTEKK